LELAIERKAFGRAFKQAVLVDKKVLESSLKVLKNTVF
jgi:hypothetical protein